MMKRIFAMAAVLICAAGGLSAEGARPVLRPKALPLALSDDFQFRKVWSFYYDPHAQQSQPTTDRMISFERQRVLFGAITNMDERERYGHYFTFHWRVKRLASLSVRLEYRQEKLGSYVQAREVLCGNVKGSNKTEFTIIGDDYAEGGRVTAWRALLIEDGRIVGLTQSALWD